MTVTPARPALWHGNHTAPRRPPADDLDLLERLAATERASSRLTERVGDVDDDTLRRVCSAVSYALGC